MAGPPSARLRERGKGGEGPPPGGEASEETVTIRVTPAPANTFTPAEALGAGVDGAEPDVIRNVYRPGAVAAMRSMNLRPLTYRLRTELGVEAWHWNPRGAWSDPARRRGYWTGSADPRTGPLAEGWGYRLPHRGSTTDQANDDGYSRVDDGDPRTFWKSNPYLDHRFTGEPDAAHPQWVVVDLGRPTAVNAVRLLWGAPYATRYRVEYCDVPPGVKATEISRTFADGARWKPFPNGAVADGRGGDASIRLASSSVTTEFVRVWMTESSGTAPAGGGRDARDRCGYALRELSVGQVGADGKFHDRVRHGRTNATQSSVVVSSCDPWHTAADRDPRTLQPGFDRVWGSGLANGRPVLVPVGVLYDTPGNAVAELKYLRARGLRFDRVELGEEPDGQYVRPEDYAALYCRFARAIRREFPKVSLGGPSLQTAVDGWIWWPDERGERSWMRRFLAYLGAHGRSNDFQFFSFEWYPFDELRPPAEQDLARHAAMLDAARANLLADGVPADIPWVLSEYGWSPFACEEEVDVPAALLNAEIAARFLQQGGSTAYLYGYEPNQPILEAENAGATWGNLMPLLADGDGTVTARLPAYWAARLLTSAWAQDGPGADRPHRLYRADCAPGDPLLAAYPVLRPDGAWSVLLINKDRRRARTVRLSVRRDGANSPSPFAGPLEVWRYGPAQYAWKADGENGRPLRSLPPEHVSVAAAAAPDGAAVTVPPFTLCVVRGEPPRPTPP